MGYRSDVVMAVDRKIYNSLLLLDKIPHLIAKEVSHTTDSAVYWVFQGVKWWDHYEDVAPYETLMDTLEEGGPCSALVAECMRERRTDAFGFLRIGEDSDDISQRGSPHDFDIYLHCAIDFPD